MTERKINIICSITGEAIRDPIMTPSGHTYEGEAIRHWVNANHNSPITRLYVSPNDLKPNYALRDIIDGVNIEVPVEVPQEKLVGYNLDFSITRDVSNLGSLYVEVVPPDVTGVPVSIVLCIDISESMGDIVVAKKEDGTEKTDGFTRLDITKHAAITVVENMRDCDMLGIVSYNDGANVEFPIAKMNKNSKKEARRAILRLVQKGTTNLFDGMRKSVELLSSIKDSYRVVKLLTDGQPNINPPSGIIPSLNRLIHSFEGIFPVIDTFGFGYLLDSELLSQISKITNGSFSFIPDGTLVGTVFINSLANTLSTVAQNVKIHVSSGYIDHSGGYPIHKNGEDISIDLGCIRSGQSKGVRISVVPGNDMFVTYNNFAETRSIRKTEDIGIVNREFKTRLDVVDFLERCYLTGLNPYKFNEVSEQFENMYIPQNCSKYESDLYADLNGQVAMTFSKHEWFERWGKNYLLSLIDAHRHCRCNNFKDPGVQHYGGERFRRLRQQCEDEFLKIDPPKPSGRGYESSPQISSVNFSQNYYSASNGCMTPDTIVTLLNNDTIKLGNLKKGDIVSTPNGYDRVRCIVRIVNSNATIVKINDQLGITPWHPMKLTANDNWKFPNDIGISEKYTGDLINIVLEKESSIWLGGCEVVCLGHHLHGPVVEHDYYGTDKVINDLRQMKGWKEGLILLHGGCSIKDPITTLTIGMVQVY